MKHTINHLRTIVEDFLQKKEYEESPEALFAPMTYALSVGGKRLRPVMTLLATYMYDGNLQYALKPAVGLEIFHNFTLLHDDVMDRASLRRGMPTVHKKWNDNVAILSGDAMSIKAYQHIVDCEDRHVRKVLEIFNNTALEVCKGQQMDMDFESEKIVPISEYMQMIYYKTAVLFACSLKLGAILADADEKESDLLYRLGINLGMAFQLQDDYLDVYGDVKVFGKNIGGDILTKKKTYLLLSAFEKANEEQKQALHDLLENEFIDADIKIEEVRQIYNNLDIKKIVNDTINKYLGFCRKNLNELNVPQEKKQELNELIAKLENRDV